MVHGAAGTAVWRATTAATRCYNERRLLRHTMLEVVRPWDGWLDATDTYAATYERPWLETLGR